MLIRFLAVADGVAAVHRKGADLQFLGAIAAAALASRPDCMLLLTADDGTHRCCPASPS